MSTPRQAALRAPFARLTRVTFAEGTCYLRERDARLGAWIDRVGRVGLRRQRHQFSTLCRSIVAQQISAHAAMSIFARFAALFEANGRPEPAALLEIEAERIRGCGISERKVAYLRSLAEAFASGALKGRRLGTLPDERVVELLVELPGIGVWTAEMFLIFALGRLDVFSLGDQALRAAVQRVEGRPLSPAAIEKRAARWAPYRSDASLYLWKISHWRGAGP